MVSSNKNEKFNEFFEIYNKKIAPQLDEIEKMRLEELNTLTRERISFLKSMLITLPCIFILTHLCAKPQQDIFCEVLAFSVFTLLILISAFFATADIQNKKFKTKLKGIFLNEMLKPFGNIRWHNYSGFLTRNEINRSGLFDFGSIETDDEFIGKYKDVPFGITECKICQGTDRKYSDLWGLFKGVILCFKFNKNIKNKTIVLSKNDSQLGLNKNIWIPLICMLIIVGMIAYIIDYAIISGSDFEYIDSHLIELILFFIFVIPFPCFFIYLYVKNKTKKINLEDLNFDKRFNVYSSDEVEARYLVTPLFMELLNNLKTAFGVKNLKCSFFDDKLMIAISTNKDLFEIGDLFTSAHNPKFIFQFYRELASIYKMIEYFKLNEKIFKTDY